MNPQATIQRTRLPVIREYTIGGTKYIVRATMFCDAKEDAAAKMRRLIRNELSAQK